MRLGFVIISFLSIALRAHAIIGGEAVESAHPLAKSTVAIVVHKTIYGNIKAPYYCTGTLVGPHAVLTAAHCLFDEKNQVLPLKSVTLSFGLKSSTENSGDQVRQAMDFKIHDDFKPSITLGEVLHDIALIRIESVPEGFDKAELPFTEAHWDAGSLVSFAGFGITEPKDRLMRSAGTLKMGQAPFLRFNDSKTGIVLGLSGDISCFGDSGGPVYSLDKDAVTVLGITSHGEGNGCAGEQVYTSVFAHRRFIDDILQSW